MVLGPVRQLAPFGERPSEEVVVEARAGLLLSVMVAPLAGSLEAPLVGGSPEVEVAVGVAGGLLEVDSEGAGNQQAGLAEEVAVLAGGSVIWKCVDV